jgi:cytochrome c peroxidase
MSILFFWTIRDTIVAFLQTLTGEKPKIDLPTLPPRTDATPLPKQ